MSPPPAFRPASLDSLHSRQGGPPAPGGGRGGGGIWPGSVSQFGGGGGALTAALPPVPVGLQGAAGNFRSAPLYFLNLAGQLQVATDGDRGEASERLPSRMQRHAPPNPAAYSPGGGGGGLLDSCTTDYSGGLSGLIVSTPCDMNDGMDVQSGMSLAVSRGLMKIGSQNSERSDCGSGANNSRFAAAAAATAAVNNGGGVAMLSRPGSYQQQHPGSPRPLGVATPPSIARDLLRIGSQSSERSETATATNSGTLPRPLHPPPPPPPPPPPMFAVTSIPESALMGRGSGMMRPTRRSSVGLLGAVPPPAAK